MNISTQAKRIGAVLAAAAITTPVALASALPFSGSYVSHPGGPGSAGSLATPHRTASLPSSRCPCNIGLPGGPAGGTPRQTASVPPSQCPCNIGLPIQPSVDPVVTAPPFSGSYISHRSSLGSTGTLQTEGLPSSQCPCNLGLPDGPNGVEQVGLAPTTVTNPRGSFDWGDAGIGAGLMAGIGTLAAGAALMLRRHRPLAQHHS